MQTSSVNVRKIYIRVLAIVRAKGKYLNIALASTMWISALALSHYNVKPLDYEIEINVKVLLKPDAFMHLYFFYMRNIFCQDFNKIFCIKWRG